MNIKIVSLSISLFIAAIFAMTPVGAQQIDPRKLAATSIQIRSENYHVDNEHGAPGVELAAFTITDLPPGATLDRLDLSIDLNTTVWPSTLQVAIEPEGLVKSVEMPVGRLLGMGVQLRMPIKNGSKVLILGSFPKTTPNGSVFKAQVFGVALTIPTKVGNAQTLIVPNGPKSPMQHFWKTAVPGWWMAHAKTETVYEKNGDPKVCIGTFTLLLTARKGEIDIPTQSDFTVLVKNGTEETPCVYNVVTEPNTESVTTEKGVKVTVSALLPKSRVTAYRNPTFRISEIKWRPYGKEQVTQTWGLSGFTTETLGLASGQ